MKNQKKDLPVKTRSTMHIPNAVSAVRLSLAAAVLFACVLSGCSKDPDPAASHAFVLDKPGEASDQNDTASAGNETADTEATDTMTVSTPTEPPVIVMNTEGDITYDPIDLEDFEEDEYVWDFDTRIFSKETKSPDEAVFTFAGDILFAEGYSITNKLKAVGNDINQVIKPEVMSGLKDCDIFMINNEFPYSDRGTPKAGKTFTFRAKPESVKYLQEMETDIVSLANNHAYDYGEEALLDTLDILRDANIPFVGAGKNITEAMQPVYYKVNKKTIAITSATQIERTPNPESKEATDTTAGVLRTLDPAKMVQCIKTAEENSNFVIVYVHWGSENTDLVEASQRELAKAYVEAGADLIIGDHPHCLQGADYVDGVPVFYSLGNFWFNSRRVETGYLKLILNTTKDDCSIKELSFVPCVQNGCITSLATDAEKEKILSYLQGVSDHATISSEGVIEYSEENHNTQNGQNTSPSKAYVRTTQEEEPTTDPALDPNFLLQLMQQQQMTEQAVPAQ
ncbi:MAG: CapA family protein [Lachnospiraceae bacterium]|nr:CapA family protein [Lachnospiraceae bacterium]